MPTITETNDARRATQSLATASTQGRAIVSNQVVSERDKKIVELLCDGHTIEQVAAKYNTTVREVQTAAERQAVLLQIELSRPENKEAAIGIELSKIDRLTAFWEFDATFGKNIEAAKFLLTCLQERAKRLNLYPATQSESKNVNINVETQMIHAGKNELVRFVQGKINSDRAAIEATTEKQDQDTEPETEVFLSPAITPTPTTITK